MKLLKILLLLLAPFTLTANEQTYYKVGIVPQYSPQTISDIWTPILEEVSKQAGIELRLVASPSIPDFEKKFSAGDFDFAYMNPYHLVVANQEQGYIPLLKDTEKKLRGIIVVRKDSHFHSIHELNGKTVAFPAPNALGAALIPRAEFANKFHIKVNELYSNSHSSVYLNVLLGIADAGGGVKKTLARQPEEVRNKLRILYTTEAVTSHPITVHPRISKDIQERVKLAFLQLSRTSKGHSLLTRVPLTKLGGASLKDYEQIKTLGLEKFYVRKP